MKTILYLSALYISLTTLVVGQSIVYSKANSSEPISVPLTVSDQDQMNVGQLRPDPGGTGALEIERVSPRNCAQPNTLDDREACSDVHKNPELFTEIRSVCPKGHTRIEVVFTERYELDFASTGYSDEDEDFCNECYGEWLAANFPGKRYMGAQRLTGKRYRELIKSNDIPDRGYFVIR